MAAAAAPAGPPGASPRYLNVMVEGCCHGAMDAIYASVADVERRRGVKVDLLIICGDFQGLRSDADFEALAVPPKYRELNSFRSYYYGEKVAPVTTVVIGGNHEASNYLGALHYGGWVAPNIYYLGAAGCVRFGGVRIGGLSGIYNRAHYELARYEYRAASLNARDAIRSCYHYREMEVFRLAQLGAETLDVFVSHDWPRGIERHGDVDRLVRTKPFFKEEIDRNDLGSPAHELLLKTLRPRHWFAAHLHVKFSAVVKHSSETATRFLALDKCLPKRDFLQLVTLERRDDDDTGLEAPVLEYDPEWLAILQKTHHLSGSAPPPARERPPPRFDKVDEQDFARAFAAALGRCNGPPHAPLAIPRDFEITVEKNHPPPQRRPRLANPLAETNPQTDRLLAMLGLDHRVTSPTPGAGAAAFRAPLADPAEVMIDDADDADAPPEAPPPVRDDAEIDLDDDDDGDAGPPTPPPETHDDAEIDLDEE